MKREEQLAEIPATQHVRSLVPVSAMMVIASFLVLIRIPFYCTGSIQEDAFISWRCAVNLAENGIYGFNAGERVSASTSHAYVFLVGFIRYICGDLFIPVVLLVNTLMVIAAIYLLSSIWFNDIWQRLALWILVSLTPTALIISYSGMETPLLIMSVAVVIYGYIQPRHQMYSHVAMAFLPWVRPDAIVYGVLISLFIAVRERQIPWAAVGSLLAGITTSLLFNYAYFGSFLHQTIVAKSTAYDIQFSYEAIARNVLRVFGLDNYGSGVFTLGQQPLFSRFSWVLMIGSLIIFFLFLRQNKDRSGRLVLTELFLSVAFFIPVIYAIGGVIFQWYLWPSSLFTNLLIGAFVIDIIWSIDEVRRRKYLVGSGLLVLCLTPFLWGNAMSAGVQESRYRRSVGEYIRAISSPSETMLLEPAGYIPFYAKIYTYDVVGLTSREVTEYQNKYGKRNWWLTFLEDKRPTYVITRRDLITQEHGPGLESLEYFHDLNSESDRSWFGKTYELLRVFKYRPEDYYSNKLILLLLNRGSHSDYYIYKLRRPQPESSA